MAPSKELRTAIKSALAAGKIQMKHFGRIHDVKEKAKNDFVTEMDIKCEKTIINIIKKSFPKHSILAEESGKSNQKSSYEWIIDPLDGTHNYLRAIPIFGVSVALAKNKEIIAGVIYLPYLDELYFAEKGKGSYLRKKKKIYKINLEKSNPAPMVAAAFRFRRNPTYCNKYLNKLTKEVKTRIFGSVTFCISMLLRKSVDASVIFLTNIWDVAAGIILVKEAKGIVKNIHYRDDNKGKNFNYVFSTREFYPRIKRIFNL